MLERIGHECVEPLADALKHDESERNARQRIEHAERLAAPGRRCRVPVACRRPEKLVSRMLQCRNYARRALTPTHYFLLRVRLYVRDVKRCLVKKLFRRETHTIKEEITSAAK